MAEPWLDYKSKQAHDSTLIQYLKINAADVMNWNDLLYAVPQNGTKVWIYYVFTFIQC